MNNTIQKLKNMTMTEQEYKAQIQSLKLQLNQNHITKAIEVIEPLCKVIGLDASQYVLSTSKMTVSQKLFCDSIIKAASYRIKKLERETTLQILDAQNKRDKAVLAAKEAMEEMVKMERLS
ncbi:Uncharacterised protein [Klebsiella pneumoniae]|uniref:hypothetical protein n=1 Tax=Klebsiella pneumoniae TaxID=573 RepID=UPI000E2B10ED|nr:hypothetical protein [Klebsiella pneumoniae]VVL52228.1 Uncharacterised protein [Klebsiella pneumoniae]